MIPCRESAEAPPVLLLGIGNLLFADEGAGVHAVRRLSRELEGLAGVCCLDGGTLGFALAADIGRCAALIVLDAADMGEPPGSVAVFEGERMDRFLGARKGRSAHELGLLDAMSAAALSGELPARRALVGIQGDSFASRAEPSAPVHRSLERACERARELIRRWL